MLQTRQDPGALRCTTLSTYRVDLKSFDYSEPSNRRYRSNKNGPLLQVRGFLTTIPIETCPIIGIHVELVADVPQPTKVSDALNRCL